MKHFYRNPEFQNTFKPIRLGKKWADNTQYPFLVREPPRYVHDQWQVDCTALQFYVKFEDGSIGRMQICVIIDTKSRFILAYNTSRYETTDLIKPAFKQAIITHKFLPIEIVHDSSKAMMSKEMESYKSRLEELGTTFRACAIDNPKDKGIVERLFLTLQGYFAEYFGFIGDGVRSTREEGRVSPEDKKEFYKNKNLKSEIDIKDMVDAVITKYNTQHILSADVTPHSLFEKCSKKNAIVLSNAYYIKLFAIRVVKKKVYRSMIQFIPHGEKAHFYIVFDPEIRAKINNTWVKVRFMDSEPDVIYVFHLLTDHFITSLKRFRPIVTDLANRTKDEALRLLKNSYYLQLNKTYKPKDFYLGILTSMGIFDFSADVPLRYIVNKVSISLAESKKKNLLIVDDAGRFNPEMLEFIQQIRDATKHNTGIILAGTIKFKMDMNKWVRNNVIGMPELYTRISDWTELQRPTEDEIFSICKANGVIDSDTISGLAKKCKDYRTLANAIQLIKLGEPITAA